MAVDLRPYNCLPEHQGPAFRTWSRIIQTAAMSAGGSPTSPLLSPNSCSNLESSFPSLLPAGAQEFIPFNDSKKEELRSQEAKKNKAEKSRGNCSVENGEHLANGSSDVGEVSSLIYAPWKKQTYPENAYGLHLEINDFYEYMSPSPEESLMRKNVVERISNLILGIWPAARVEVFGSYKTKLYLPTSDIDLVVFGNWEKLPLWTLERALVNQDVAEQSTIKVLDKASVPIVKLTDKRSNIKMDISFNMDTAVKGAALIQEFLKEYKILPRLFLVLKHFLVMRDLNEVFTGGISSYCLMLLTVSFLQMHPRQESKLPDANLGVLLIEFFELYGRNFNYQRTGIKIRNGGCYCSKDEIMREMAEGQFPSLLCIEDPVSKVIDIGKSSFGIMRVKEAFEYAYNVLDSALRNRHYFKINPDSTYLSRIIQIPKEVLQYRKWVKYQYEIEIESKLIEPEAQSKPNSDETSSKDVAAKPQIIDAINVDEFPPLQSSTQMTSQLRKSSSKENNKLSPRLTNNSSSFSQRERSISQPNQLSLSLSSRLSDIEKKQHQSDSATRAVAEKRSSKESEKKMSISLPGDMSKTKIEDVKESTKNTRKDPVNIIPDVIEIGSNSDDNLIEDEFVLEPHLQGMSWGDICDEENVEEESPRLETKSKKTEPLIGSGGASMWSGDEGTTYAKKSQRRPNSLMPDYSHHDGKRHGFHNRTRRSRSPCEGIGEQYLASARHTRQLIISSPEKPIVRPEKWAREETKHFTRESKVSDHPKSPHSDRRWESRSKSTGGRDPQDHHSSESNTQNTKYSFDHHHHHHHHDDNFHSHKYGSGHRRRNKRDNSKPF